jgi:hypothetical protein
MDLGEICGDLRLSVSAEQLWPLPQAGSETFSQPILPKREQVCTRILTMLGFGDPGQKVLLPATAALGFHKQSAKVRGEVGVIRVASRHAFIALE